MTLRITASPNSIIATGPEIIALFRTRRSILAGLDAAHFALERALENLERAQQPPPAPDAWNRYLAALWTPQARAEGVALAAAGVARCRLAISKREVELAALDAEEGA
jgi:hypothetical protein